MIGKRAVRTPSGGMTAVQATSLGRVYVIALLCFLGAWSLTLTGIASAAVARPECHPTCPGVTDDGKRAIFDFDSALTEEVEQEQIYVRYGGVTRSVVHYADGSPQLDTGSSLLGYSDDGRYIFFDSFEGLVPSDQDENDFFSHNFGRDIYQWHEGEISLVSQQVADNDPDPYGVWWGGHSPDGTRAYLISSGRLTPDDPDGCEDLYEAREGQLRLVTTGPSRTATPDEPFCDMPKYLGESQDGTQVFFSSRRTLVPEDTDENHDVYRNTGGVVSLVTDYEQRGCPWDGPIHDDAFFGGTSADGATVLFTTSVRLAPGDLDDAGDAYVRNPDGSFELVTTGTEVPGEGCPSYKGSSTGEALSSDGNLALFRTETPVVDQDRNNGLDLYLHNRSTGENSLISTGPTDPHGFLSPRQSWFRAQFFDASDDLRHIAFESPYQLVQGDTDDNADVYERVGDTTRLVSVGSEGGNGDVGAKLLSVSGDGDSVVFSTREQLVPIDVDRAIDFYVRKLADVTVPGGAGSKRSRVRRRVTRLISVESIAPRMRVRRNGALRDTFARIHLRCPAAETSGPCRGTARLTVRGGKRTLGRGTFRIKAGASKSLRIRLTSRGRSMATGARRLRVRVNLRAADRIGNERRSARPVILSRKGSS